MLKGNVDNFGFFPLDSINFKYFIGHFHAQWFSYSILFRSIHQGCQHWIDFGCGLKTFLGQLLGNS